MSRLFIPFVLLFLYLFKMQCVSQNNNIVVKSEMDKDLSVKFSYEKKDYGTHYLQVNFKYLENSNSNGFRGNIQGPIGSLFTIKPNDPQRSIAYSYDYSWIRGKLMSKIDTGFIYLLPVSKGNAVKVFNHSYLYTQYFGANQPRNWKSFQFNVSEGDTVFSARKGLVVEVNDGFEPDTAFFYSSKSNSILVEHEDGTLARYSVLKKGSITVKSGQTVFAHVPMAVAGTYNLSGNSQISFSVCYLTEDKLDNSGHTTIKTIKHYYSFVDPIFHTSEGDIHLKANQNYTADFNYELITKELSKREKKLMESQKLIYSNIR